MNKTVLVIDDNKLNLYIAEKLLRSSYDVLCAHTGPQALNILENRIPHLILLDIQMPEMDGFEVMNRIKEKKKWVNIPVIFLTANNQIEVEAKCLEIGAVDFISKPFEPTIMLKRVQRSIELSDFQMNLHKIIEEKTRRLEELQYEFTREIADIVEGRDCDTGGHVQRTSKYVELILFKLKEKGLYKTQLTDEYIHKTIQASVLHDIGKINISDTILNKPDKLTTEEFAEMKLHVKHGLKMIEKLLRHYRDDQYFDIAKEIVYYHHEKWNGGGYLNGIKGKEIPLSARIMAVADVFDALISKRCYKEAFPISEAYNMIESLKGIHFDPQIADAFLEMKPEIERIIATYSC